MIIVCLLIGRLRLTAKHCELWYCVPVAVQISVSRWSIMNDGYYFVPCCCTGFACSWSCLVASKCASSPHDCLQKEGRKSWNSSRRERLTCKFLFVPVVYLEHVWLPVSALSANLGLVLVPVQFTHTVTFDLQATDLSAVIQWRGQTDCLLVLCTGSGWWKLLHRSILQEVAEGKSTQVKWWKRFGEGCSTQVKLRRGFAKSTVYRSSYRRSLWKATVKLQNWYLEEQNLKQNCCQCSVRRKVINKRLCFFFNQKPLDSV